VSLTSELSQVLKEAAERLDVPGVAVGVTQDGKDWYAYHGLTSVENPLDVDEHTLFQIGSTGKTYTGTMVMQLVERGKLALDDPVRKHIPSFRVADAEVSEKVTILHLLNHTAGWEGDFFLDTGQGDEALERFVAAMADVRQTSTFGGIASYNDAALSVAGHVIEKVTGLTYEQAMKEMILDPLGLNETFTDLNSVITRRFAVGHIKQDDELTVSRQFEMPRSAAPGGVPISTASDQIRWARFHLGNLESIDRSAVLSGESLRRMQLPTAEQSGGSQVGISWMLREIDGVSLVSHGGTTFGQQSSFDLVPERQFAMTVLTNAHHASLLANEITNWVFDRCLGLTKSKPEPELLPADASTLAEYAGKYSREELYCILELEGENLLLTIAFTDEGRHHFIKELGALPPIPGPFHVGMIAADEFIAIEGEYKGDRFKFLRDDNGSIVSVDLGGRLAQKTES
jgi:CubicO group peptidase (beta-lactamase class C family)